MFVHFCEDQAHCSVLLPDTLERWALPAPGQVVSVDPNDCGLIGSYLRNGDKTEGRT